MTKTTFPDLESLVSGISNDKMTIDKEEAVSERECPESLTAIDTDKSNPADSLWSQFIKEINNPKDNFELSKKSYRIDSDIVQTLAQCDFKVSTTCAINSILKTFIVANITNLRNIRKQPPKSFFDDIQ